MWAPKGREPQGPHSHQAPRCLLGSWCGLGSLQPWPVLRGTGPALPGSGCAEPAGPGAQGLHTRAPLTPPARLLCKDRAGLSCSETSSGGAPGPSAPETLCPETCAVGMTQHPVHMHSGLAAVVPFCLLGCIQGVLRMGTASQPLAGTDIPKYVFVQSDTTSVRYTRTGCHMDASRRCQLRRQ